MNGVLKTVPLARLIPRRLRSMYLDLLGRFSFDSESPENQLIIDLITWTYCKIKDIQDHRFLYSRRHELDDYGKLITTLADSREKQQELELLPTLQKQLVTLITALREGQKKQVKDTPNQLAEALSRFAGSGIENLD